MAEPEGNSSKPLSIPWTPLLALLAAVAGLAALLPSRSARPTAVSMDATLVERQEVSARLWQDPLSVAREAAVKEHVRDAATANPAEDSPPLARMGEWLWTWRNSLPVVLAVCEPSSPYAEDVERRLRDRVAVVHALAAEGYLPERSTRLSYARTKPGTTEGLVPYEGFLPLTIGSRPAVLVVWLADGTLGDGPLEQLANLGNGLKAAAGAVDPSWSPAVRVLGPSNSLQYRRLLDELKAVREDDDWKRALGSTRVFSCKASAPEDVLAARVPWSPAESALLHDTNVVAAEKRQPGNGTGRVVTELLRVEGGNFSLTRTICADDQLARALWEELGRRQVKPHEPAVAIAELDSFFGRASTLAFLHTRLRGMESSDPLDLELARQNSPNVRTFSHLAGLDGALPKNAFGAEDRAATKESAPSGGGTSRAVSAAREPTEGFSQVDYLRRLADRLAEEDYRLVVQSPGWLKAPGFRAVAVLGSDIYDKLQIFRTLRPRLSGALFLTLGLDARLGHPDEWDGTRNVIAAANYALNPERTGEREGLSFRDSDQAAVYAAARIALSDHPDEAILKWQGQPRLFEVGRAGPVLLPVAWDPQRDHLGVVTWLKFGFCGLLALLLLWLLRVGIGAWERRRWFERSGVAVPVALGLALLVTVGRYYLWQRVPGEEPFGIMTGVSVWPGDCVRLFVLLLSLHFAAKILCQLGSNRQKLQEQFALAPPDEPGWRTESGPVWRRRWRDFWPRTEPWLDPGGNVWVSGLWLRYQTWGSKRNRVVRAVLLTTLYFLALTLWVGAMNEPWPQLPVRGAAFGPSRAILILAVLGSLFVTFLVVDATELNWRFIRDLNVAPTNWGFRRGWGGKDRYQFARHRELLDPEDCADYLDIELIASRSEMVNGLVYYPFILLTLLVVARWGVTDYYLWPPALLTAFGANAAWTLYCAIRLPIEANRARANSLARLRRRLYVRRCAEAEGQSFKTSSVAALEGVIAQIERLNRGAFVGVWEQPVLRALLVPSSSAGLWALLEFLPR